MASEWLIHHAQGLHPKCRCTLPAGRCHETRIWSPLATALVKSSSVACTRLCASYPRCTNSASGIFENGSALWHAVRKGETIAEHSRRSCMTVNLAWMMLSDVPNQPSDFLRCLSAIPTANPKAIPVPGQRAGQSRVNASGRRNCIGYHLAPSPIPQGVATG